MPKAILKIRHSQLKSLGCARFLFRRFSLAMGSTSLRLFKVVSNLGQLKHLELSEQLNPSKSTQFCIMLVSKETSAAISANCVFDISVQSLYEFEEQLGPNAENTWWLVVEAVPESIRSLPPSVTPQNGLKFGGLRLRLATAVRAP